MSALCGWFKNYRWNYKAPVLATVEFMLVTDHRLQNRCVLSETSKKAIVASVVQDEGPNEPEGTKKTRTRRTTTRGRKKATTELQDGDSELTLSASASEQEISDPEASISGSEKPKRRTRKKGIRLCYLR